MKVLGITGGVGAGKSTVLNYLETEYGARVIQADQAGHLVQEPGGACYGEIIRIFGTEILMKDGRIDRGRLGALVYADRGRLKMLNGIVHPAVRTFIIEEIRKTEQENLVPFVVVEAALLLEAGYDEICDEVWYVYAGEEVRCGRLMESRGYSAEKAYSIMRNQLKEKEFRKLCDFVIDNSGNFMENTREQIDKGLVEHGFL